MDEQKKSNELSWRP